MKLLSRTALAAVALLLYMFSKANNIKEKKQIIKLKTNNNFLPFRLAFIADIHRKKLPKDFLVTSVDAIIIGGDLTERRVPLERTANNLRILTDAAPVYFVWGNNDHEIGDRNLRKLLNHYKVKILDNESMTLFGDSRIKLVGVDFYSDRDAKLKKAFSKVDINDTVLFVAHSPADFKHVQTHKNIGLMMAGHTHGGQIRVGKIGLYKVGALKNKNDRYELVTNGYGTTSVPLRLGAEAQYHVLDILPRANK